MQKITFQDTEVVKAPYVLINGVEYPVIFETAGGTDLDAETFNGMQDNIEDAIDDKQDILVNETNIKSLNVISIVGSGEADLSPIIANSISAQTEEISIPALPAQGELYNQTKSVTIPQGYKCDGIKGWKLSGGGFTNIFINELWLECQNGTSLIHYSVKNYYNGATADLVLTVYLGIVATESNGE